MNAREFWALAPLVVFMFWIGLKPQTFLAPMQADINEVSARVEAALNRREAAAVAGTVTPINPPMSAVAGDAEELARADR